jgi:hypothetical protein
MLGLSFIRILAAVVVIVSSRINTFDLLSPHRCVNKRAILPSSSTAPIWTAKRGGLLLVELKLRSLAEAYA